MPTPIQVAESRVQTIPWFVHQQPRVRVWQLLLGCPVGGARVEQRVGVGKVSVNRQSCHPSGLGDCGDRGEVFDVTAGGLGDPQAEQPQHGDERKVDLIR